MKNYIVRVRYECRECGESSNKLYSLCPVCKVEWKEDGVEIEEEED